MKRLSHEDLYAQLHFSLFGVHDSHRIRQTLLLLAVPGYTPNNHPSVDRLFGREGNQVAMVVLQRNRVLEATWCWDGTVLHHQFDSSAERLYINFKDILRMVDVTDNLADVNLTLRMLQRDSHATGNSRLSRFLPAGVDAERRHYMIEALEVFAKLRGGSLTS